MPRVVILLLANIGVLIFARRMTSSLLAGITYVMSARSPAQGSVGCEVLARVSAEHLSSPESWAERSSAWAAPSFCERAGLCVTGDHILLSLGLVWSLVTSSQS